MSALALIAPAGGGNSAATIRQTEQLRRLVSDSVRNVEKSITANKAKRAEIANAERAAAKAELQARIQENVAASRQAEVCTRSIDDSIKETSLWITKLHHERYKQFAALSVCDRRLALREENPPELARDALQDNLEAEQRVLQKVRDDFMALEAEVATVVRDLEDVRSYLVKDAASRRLQCETDRAKLVNVALAAAVAPGARSLSGAKLEKRHEAFTMEETQAFFQQRLTLEEKAAALRQTSMETIKTAKMDCARARDRVEKSLSKQTEQSLETTRQLISQGKEADQTILMATRSLGENHKFIDTKDRRMDATYKDARTRLAQLSESRQHIQDDYKKHTIKLLTSEACRKVTPQVASSPPAKHLRQRPASAASGTGARGRSRAVGLGNSHSCSALPALGKSCAPISPSPEVPKHFEGGTPEAWQGVARSGLGGAQVPKPFEGGTPEAWQGVGSDAPEVTPAVN